LQAHAVQRDCFVQTECRQKLDHPAWPACARAEAVMGMTQVVVVETSVKQVEVDMVVG